MDMTKWIIVAKLFDDPFDKLLDKLHFSYFGLDIDEPIALSKYLFSLLNIIVIVFNIQNNGGMRLLGPFDCLIVHWWYKFGKDLKSRKYLYSYNLYFY